MWGVNLQKCWIGERFSRHCHNYFGKKQLLPDAESQMFSGKCIELSPPSNINNVKSKGRPAIRIPFPLNPCKKSVGQIVAKGQYIYIYTVYTCQSLGLLIFPW